MLRVIRVWWCDLQRNIEKDSDISAVSTVPSPKSHSTQSFHKVTFAQQPFPFLPSISPLHYHLSFDTMASTSSSTATGSSSNSRDEKIRTGLSHKSDGNAAFVRGDIPSALRSYHLSLLYLSGLENRSILGLMGENSGDHGQPEDLSSDESDSEPTTAAGNSAAETESALSAVHSNMAACYLKQSNYKRAIESAEKALKSDSKNVKAKYRKAQAMRLSGELWKAQEYLEEILGGMEGGKGKGKEEVKSSFEGELRAVKRAIEEKEEKSRGKWKGFLSGEKGKVVLSVGNREEAVSGGKGKGKEKEEGEE